MFVSPTAAPQVPVLRRGEPYASLDLVDVCDPRDGTVLASVAQANAGLIARDLRRISEARTALARLSTQELVGICVRGGARFMRVQTAEDDPNAQLADFTDHGQAERVNATVDKALASAGAEDVTARFRQGNRLVRKGGLAFLLPTVVRCGSFDHPAANREFLFPYASVVEASFQDPEALAERLGPTLALTAITRDPALIDALVRTRNVERLNLGPVPTPTVRWDQPHEGTLFEFLFRRRAFERREWSPT